MSGPPIHHIDAGRSVLGPEVMAVIHGSWAGRRLALKTREIKMDNATDATTPAEDMLAAARARVAPPPDGPLAGLLKGPQISQAELAGATVWLAGTGYGLRQDLVVGAAAVLTDGRVALLQDSEVRLLARLMAARVEVKAFVTDGWSLVTGAGRYDGILPMGRQSISGPGAQAALDWMQRDAGRFGLMVGDWGREAIRRAKIVAADGHRSRRLDGVNKAAVEALCMALAAALDPVDD